MNFPQEATTDRFNDTSRLQWALLLIRRVAHAAGGWFGPLLFACALALGLIVSMVWLRFHPLAAFHPSASETALVLDPVHKPLPTPLGGISAGPPVEATPAPPPQIAEALPEPTDPSLAEATQAQGSQGTAEITPTQPSDMQENAVERADHDPAMLAEGESEPRVIARTEPEYPVEALPEHAQGSVRLQVSVDAEGSVEEVRITGSSGSSALDTAAVQSVRTWRYKPAMRGGRPVAGTANVAVDFRLSEQ